MAAPSSHEPTPQEYNPALGPWQHGWRTVLSLVITAVVWGTVAGPEWQHARPLFWTDLVVGVAAFVLSFYRRRWPFAIALITAVFGALSASSAGPGTLAAVSLATRRVVWQIVVVGVVAVGASQVFSMLEDSSGDGPWWVTLSVGVAFTVVTLVWGMYIGSRRALVRSLQDRAERAEAEQALRVGQERANERARIAREMHDVLAHRITLITMHAGALAYRDDLSREEIRTTAELIQTKSHEALTDLRQVLGILRGDEAGAAELRERPQPTFRDLEALVGEAQESGMSVRYDARVQSADEMPDTVGRTAYRIVQEGLTNARKHAPGATVLVAVEGSPADGLKIRIRNPAQLFGSHGPPGAGLGLVGLRERAKLAGGTVQGGRDGGGFVLQGWLPWTT